MESVIGSNRICSELLEKKWLTEEVVEIKLQRPDTLLFLPGQFMRFHHQEIQRDYSIVSHPDSGTIDFCIALVDGGLFSNTLGKASFGTLFQLSGPHGQFIYHRSDNPAVFVATGTGVAPFVCFCRAKKAEQARLLHGVSSTKQLIYKESIKENVGRYIPCISNPAGSDIEGQNNYRGRVTDYLEQILETGRYDFYLCGHRAMIRDAVRIIDKRFEQSRLFIETYD